MQTGRVSSSLRNCGDGPRCSPTALAEFWFSLHACMRAWCVFGPLPFAANSASGFRHRGAAFCVSTCLLLSAASKAALPWILSFPKRKALALAVFALGDGVYELQGRGCGVLGGGAFFFRRSHGRRCHLPSGRAGIDCAGGCVLCAFGVSELGLSGAVGERLGCRHLFSHECFGARGCDRQFVHSSPRRPRRPGRGSPVSRGSSENPAPRSARGNSGRP